MYIQYNTNPKCNRVGDCTVRAISKALEQPWEETYIDMCLFGLLDYDMPSSNAVWGKYLKSKGFKRRIVEENNDSPTYTVADFCRDHPQGIFIMAISGHVVAVQDGNYFDTWDSGQCIPVYYWRKG